MYLWVGRNFDHGEKVVPLQSWQLEQYELLYLIANGRDLVLKYLCMQVVMYGARFSFIFTQTVDRGTELRQMCWPTTNQLFKNLFCTKSKACLKHMEQGSQILVSWLNKVSGQDNNSYTIEEAHKKRNNLVASPTHPFILSSLQSFHHFFDFCLPLFLDVLVEPSSGLLVPLQLVSPSESEALPCSG